MEWTFEIGGTLPSLNEYLRAERTFRRGYKGEVRSAGNEMKRDCQYKIVSFARKQLPRGLNIKNPVKLEYTFYEPNEKRDMDNVAACAHKFVQDALVLAKYLNGDGWKHIQGFKDEFFVDKENPRIVVKIYEVSNEERIGYQPVCGEGDREREEA